MEIHPANLKGQVNYISNNICQNRHYYSNNGLPAFKAIHGICFEHPITIKINQNEIS